MTQILLNHVELDASAIELTDGKAKQVWIQVAKPGVFKGHPAGEFKLDGTVFADIVRNFRATQNRRVAIDFEHASEQPAHSGSIPRIGAPAQGWIVDFEIRPDGLYSLVEWLPLAAQYIKDGAYRFFSPAIRFDAVDRVTGKRIGARMTSGALSNRPFLDGMLPLVASEGASLIALPAPKAQKAPRMLTADERAKNTITRCRVIRAENPKLSYDEAFTMALTEQRDATQRELSEATSLAREQARPAAVPSVLKLCQDIQKKNPHLDYDSAFTMALKEQALLT